MTGRITYTPEATRHLEALDDWIAEVAGPMAARRFVKALLDHIEGILVFPRAGRSRDDVRPGVRTTTYKKRTLIAYWVDDSETDVIVTVVGVFHGGPDWESALRERG